MVCVLEFYSHSPFYIISLRALIARVSFNFQDYTFIYID